MGGLYRLCGGRAAAAAYCTLLLSNLVCVGVQQYPFERKSITTTFTYSSVLLSREQMIRLKFFADGAIQTAAIHLKDLSAPLKLASA